MCVKTCLSSLFVKVEYFFVNPRCIRYKLLMSVSHRWSMDLSSVLRNWSKICGRPLYSVKVMNEMSTRKGNHDSWKYFKEEGSSNPMKMDLYEQTACLPAPPQHIIGRKGDSDLKWPPLRAYGRACTSRNLPQQPDWLMTALKLTQRDMSTKDSSLLPSLKRKPKVSRFLPLKRPRHGTWRLWPTWWPKVKQESLKSSVIWIGLSTAQ